VGDQSRIEWTDATLNIVTGCTRVSEGCRRCYIERTPPFYQAGRKFDGDGIGATTGVLLHPERLAQPLRWTRPRRVFVNSLADLFHATVPNELIARLWVVMALTPRHTYQVLTKRPARMRGLLTGPRWTGLVRRAVSWVVDHIEAPMPLPDIARVDAWLATPERADDVLPPLPNVWVGVSTEDQKTADQRIPDLLDTPAAVRWISAEPLLGPIDLRAVRGLDGQYGCRGAHLGRGTAECPTGRHHHHDDRCRFPLDWVVVGGESGPGARPMHPQWARDIRDACARAGVPLLFKQWGDWGPAPWAVRVCDPAVGWRGTDDELAAAKRDAEARGATHAYAVWAHEHGWETYRPNHKPWSLERADSVDERYHAPIRRWGKKRAGRELDGVLHDEYPAVTR